MVELERLTITMPVNWRRWLKPPSPKVTMHSPAKCDTRIPIKPSLLDRLSDAGEDTVKETHELVLRLNQLLDKNNVQQMKQILINIESATSRFSTLQNSADKALAQVPALTADARRALSEVNELTDEFKQLSRQMRQELAALSKQSGDLMQTGASVGQQLLQTTMPRANTLMLQMQATIHRFDRVARMLETDPQAFLLGAEPLSPGQRRPSSTGEPRTCVPFSCCWGIPNSRAPLAISASKLTMR